ncbi:MAG: hypothetical protein DME23_19970 [Verrucomicrobia bacterium]|nr:MAG: hypothetical protein DME23_19970 [Verrucomicrobiota bacterium]
MAVNTSSATSAVPVRREVLVLLLCLLPVLGILFHRSFRPEEVLFSNDGPLGAVAAQAGHAWDNLRGVWQDLNWLGSRQPAGFLAIGYAIFACLGPLLYSKFIAPISLLVLGLGAWLFFRQLRFSPLACVLGSLAAALNTNAFSVSCWGLPGWTFSRSCLFLALAALPDSAVRQVWLRAILGGLAVGLALTDGFDVGAIFSLYVAAYVVFQSFTAERNPTKKFATAASRVALVAICGALIAAQALTTLIGTQIKGIVGMEQDKQTKERRWDEATSASLRKVEALRIIIPGLFGYRMPELYGEPVESANGSNYWGAMGQSPVTLRHSGGGEFAGVLVVLIAVWACAQSFRKQNNPFTADERKTVWFWAGAAIISLLLAFGKYAPFYRLVYALPYFSTVRNPFKFLHPFHAALAILFAYGLEGLSRRYLLVNATAAKSAILQIRSWWKTAPAFDRKWTTGSLAAVGAGLLGWLIYAASRNELVRYLQQAGFPDQLYPQLAASIARFSLDEVGMFILFLVLSIAVLTLVLGGAFSGRKAKWAGVALGLLLVIDLSRADVPWIVYYNYKDKYATNPILDLLKDNEGGTGAAKLPGATWERRVTAELVPMTRTFVLEPKLYFEWLQHHFQFYRIQSLDIIQMPRQPEFDAAYMKAFRPSEPGSQAVTAESLCSFQGGRLWQLTNTRYLLGPVGLLDILNRKSDPQRHRFRIYTRFNIVTKPGVRLPTTPEEVNALKAEQLTASVDTNGQFALLEFDGALSRAKLFTQWQVNTNDPATLQQLASPDFDPAQTVLVANELPAANPTNTTLKDAGAVEFAHYEPKFVRLNANAVAACVLLLNDRFDPDWKVLVDGKPETLLRCNYIMRGVYLAPGQHVVEFHFAPSARAFYVSLGSLIAGVALCGFLVVSRRRSESPPEQTATKRAGRN